MPNVSECEVDVVGKLDRSKGLGAMPISESNQLRFQIKHLILMTFVACVWATSVRWFGIDPMMGFFVAPLLTANVAVALLLIYNAVREPRQ